MKQLLFVPLLAFAALSVQAQETDAAGEAENWDPPAPVPHEPLDAEVQGLPEEQAAGNAAGSQEIGQVGSPSVEGREPGNDPLAAPDERNRDAAARARSTGDPSANVELPEGEVAQGEPGQAASLVREFSEADRDGDGILSIEEARQAFPESVEIIDSDRDGELSKLELQTGVPGLLFEEGGESLSESRITEREWDTVLQVLDDDGQVEEEA